MTDTPKPNGITAQQLLDSLSGGGSLAGEYSDGLRGLERGLNQTRAIIAQVLEASAKATARVAELEKENAALTKSLGEATDLLNDAKIELARHLTEAQTPEVAQAGV